MALLTTLLVSAAMSVVVAHHAVAAAAANGQNAPLASTPIVTYNMDGSNAGDSVWTNTIARIIPRAAIMLLQEAGSGPPGVQVEAPQTFPGVPGAGTGDAGVVRHHRWQHGNDFSEVYFLQTDRQAGRYVGGRVNLAIVTQNEADEVTVLPNPQAGSRPLLGVRFGQNWYFTYHAQSRGPSAWRPAMAEAQGVLQAAQNFVTARGRGETWFVGGDFNVQPSENGTSLPMPAGATMYQPHGQPTHQSGRTLDYGVGSESVPTLPVTVPFGRTSDHFPVAFGALRAAAEPQELYSQSPRLIENMASGGVISTYNANATPPTVLSTTQRQSDPAQQWTLFSYADGTYQIAQPGNAQCIAVASSGTSAQSASCSFGTAAAPAGQQWELHPYGNEQYELFSPSNGRCLGNGDSSNRISASALPLEQCDGSAGQHWLLTPTENPATDQGLTALDPHVISHEYLTGALENAEYGQLLDTNPDSTSLHVTQRTVATSTRHNWTFDWVGDDVVKLFDQPSDRCVQSNGGGITALATCSVSGAQEWTVVPIGENEFQLQTGGDCLGLLNDSGVDVATTTYACGAGTTSTRWFFAPADTSAPDPDAEDPGSGGANPATRIMVVGDSISEGFEGDYTWRYRLDESLIAANANVDFVGPYNGTQTQGDPGPIPETPPATVGQPTPASPGPHTDGGYRNGLTFDSAHYALWGRQAAQDAGTIQGVVAQYQPDLLLVELGFNDLGWFVSSPQGTLDSIQRLITNARNANPNIDIALANVPQRTPLGGRADLPGLISGYNALLAQNVGSMSTATSKVALVDIAGTRDVDTDEYDGLHPNTLGEYHIAQAFETTLKDSFGIGTGAETVPSDLPALPLATPTDVQAIPTDGGIEVKWDRVYGAAAYDLQTRDVTMGTDWTDSSASTDDSEIHWLLDNHQYEFRVASMRGNYLESAFSPTFSATTSLKVADPPTGITTLPDGDTSIQVFWNAATGAYSDTISEYGVLYYDATVPGSYLESQWVTADTRSTTLTGLVQGHTYDVFVESWNAAGTGLPGGGRPVVAGAGTPAAPTLTTVETTSPTDVQLAWTAVPGATGYQVWSRDAVAGNDFTAGGIMDGTSTGVAYLYPGAQRFEFCVSALNGNDPGPRSACVRAPAPSTSSSTARTPSVTAAPSTATDPAPPLLPEAADPARAAAILLARPSPGASGDAALPLQPGG